MNTRTFAAAMAGAAISISFAASGAQAGDAAKGEQVFKRCAACHTIEAGAPNRVGPNLHGVVGREAGSLDGYPYSKGMKNAGFVWDEANLKEYLKDPKKKVPHNKMGFPGLKKEDQIEDVIAYLKANS